MSARPDDPPPTQAPNPNPWPVPYNYAPIPVYLAPPKSRTAFVLLGLFLGGLGIHNFYAGYVGRGIAQLLITLLLFWTVVTVVAVWIWVLLEVALVTRTPDGRPFS